jgi:hypothetical protein
MLLEDRITDERSTRDPNDCEFVIDLAFAANEFNLL